MSNDSWKRREFTEESAGLDRTRQYGKSIEQIRGDHVKRYLFAADRIKGKKVLDLACGCGYGSWLMHGNGGDVTGIDIEPEAIEYAKKYYQGPTYLCQRAEDTTGKWDALVSFETLEHLEAPETLLRGVQAPLLIASVPNEDRYPFNAATFSGDAYPHKRHYRPKEFEDLLRSAGYMVTERFCQKNKGGDISEGTDGIFLIYVGGLRSIS